MSGMKYSIKCPECKGVICYNDKALNTKIHCPGCMSEFELIGEELTANYELVGSKLGALLDEKRKAYGNGATTATEILKILYPNGVSVEQYQDMLLMVRVLDKLCRIANAKEALNENPWMDIAGYGILGYGEKEHGK